MIVVHTLGTAQIDVDGTQVLPTSPRKFALLLYLAVERGRGISRGALLDLVFPGQAHAKSQHSLSEHIYQLRQAGARIISNADGIRLAPETVTSDYDALIKGETPSTATLAAIQSGLLPGYRGDHSDAFAAWLERWRERATLDLIKALKREIQGAKSVANWMFMEQAARACLSLDALNEDATFALAEIMAISGSKAQAMKLLDGYDEEVGERSTELKLSSHLLRRRIRDRLRDDYRAPAALPFLGRDREMMALSKRFELARAGHAQSVVIVGEPGIGKSRLVEEFCTKAVLDGAVTAKAVAQPVDTRRPMSVFVDLVPQLRELPGALGCSPESLKTLNRLTVHNPDARREEREESSEYVWAAIAQAIGELIDAITSEVPLILFLDDAQWVDEVSLRALGALSTPRHQRRLLLIATSRETATSRMLSQRASQSATVSLSGLTQAPIKEAVARTLARDDDVVDGGVLKWLSDTSRGNPFFLQCLLGHYQSTGQASGVPQSINALLDQQINGLSADAASVLRMMVALGRHSDPTRLIAALEMPQFQLQNALNELERHQLVALQADRVEAAHWLIADAAKRTNTPIAARLMSRRVASLLEQDARETQSPALLWDCAERWVEAGDNEKAIAVLQACADHSLEIGRPREAAETILRASTLAGRAAPVDLARKAIDLADKAGENDVSLIALKALREANPGNEFEDLELIEIRARLSQWDSGPDIGDRLRQWIHPRRPQSERLYAAFVLLIYADQASDVAAAQEAHDTVADLARQVEPDSPDTLSIAKAQLVYHAAFGELDAARAIGRHLLAIANSQNGAEAANLQRTAAIGLMRAGDEASALAAFHAAYANAKKAGLRRQECILATSIGGYLVAHGSYAEGNRWLDDGEETATQLADSRLQLDLLLSRCEFAYATHNVELAKTLLDFAKRLLGVRVAARMGRWVRAIEIGIRQMEGSATVERDVDILIAHHIPNREPAELSDLEVTIAMNILVDSGNPRDARTLFDRYVNGYRRGSGPMARYLEEALARIIASESRPNTQVREKANCNAR